MPDQDETDAAAIADALSRLRGRRMPRPWEQGPFGGGDPGAHRGLQAGPRHPGHHGGHHAPRSGAAGGGVPGFGSEARGGNPWSGRLGGPARMRMLEVLAAASDPLTVGEIAEAVGVDQPRASRLVQQSVDLDLVRREADPGDARRTRVALTDAGRALARGFRGERREAVDSALAGFTDAERAELARLLTKLADAWPGRGGTPRDAI